MNHHCEVNIPTTHSSQGILGVPETQSCPHCPSPVSPQSVTFTSGRDTSELRELWLPVGLCTRSFPRRSPAWLGARFHAKGSEWDQGGEAFLLLPLQQLTPPLPPPCHLQNSPAPCAELLSWIRLDQGEASSPVRTAVELQVAFQESKPLPKCFSSYGRVVLTHL